MVAGSVYKLRGAIIMAIGISLVFISIITGWFYLTKNESPPARLEMYIGDQRRMFEGDVTENMTVLDALYASALAGNIVFQYSIDRTNNEAKILALDGHTPRSIGKDDITVYVNNNRVSLKKIHSMKIGPGDHIIVHLK